jgi:hypothetical protein
MESGQSTVKSTARRPNTAGLRPPWPKGKSGNPGGRPAKKPITELYERVLNDPKSLKELELSLRKIIKKANVGTVMQLREMTDRIEGKVTQPIAADVTVSLADAIAEARKRAGK